MDPVWTLYERRRFVCEIFDEFYMNLYEFYMNFTGIRINFMRARYHFFQKNLRFLPQIYKELQFFF